VFSVLFGCEFWMSSGLLLSVDVEDHCLMNLVVVWWYGARRHEQRF